MSETEVLIMNYVSEAEYLDFKTSKLLAEERDQLAAQELAESSGKAQTNKSKVPSRVDEILAELGY